MNPLSVEQFKEALPAQMKKTVSQELMNSINQLITDEEVREAYKDNLISFSGVLKEGKFKVTSYLDAVRYVSYKMMGDTNMDAYAKTFPDKMNRFAQENKSDKEISSYVCAFNKTKLVTLVMERSLVPVHILNADSYQKAINVQVELMMTAKSEKVRSDAANSVLTHLKPPETKKIQLDVGVKEDSAIAQLRETTARLVKQQKDMLDSGMVTAKDVAHSNLVIEGTAEVVNG